jgi:hypothetical protein
MRWRWFYKKRPNFSGGCYIYPAHLYEGTHQDNMADRARNKRTARGSKNGNAKLTETIVENVMRLLDSGEDESKLAKSLSVTRQTIRNIRMWCAKKPRGQGGGLARGSRNGKAKLTETIVEDVMRRLQAGESSKQVTKDLLSVTKLYQTGRARPYDFYLDCRNTPPIRRLAFSEELDRCPGVWQTL